jgi:hypothetical protein
MWHINVPWLWVVVVIMCEHGSCLVVGKVNRMGLEVPKGM